MIFIILKVSFDTPMEGTMSETIVSLLETVRGYIVNGEYDFLVYREKNKKTLEDYGITAEFLVSNIFDELEPGDLFRGPIPDKDPNKQDGDVYIFMKDINCIIPEISKKFYIKFKIVEENNKKLIILSLHEEGMFE